MATETVASEYTNGTVSGEDFTEDQEEIASTMDYSLFHYDPRNRPISNSHVERLKESIQRKNRLDRNPIDVDDTGRILDGQHRYEAAKELGVPIYFRITEMDMTDVPHENRAQRSWKPDDFVNYFAESGNQDYRTLRRFMNRNDHLSLSFCAEILGASSRNGMLQAIRRGEFEVDDVDYAQMIADRIKDFYDLGYEFTNKKSFCRSIKRLSESDNYDHDRMIRKAHKLGLNHQANTQDYLHQFERTYNHGKTDRVQLF